MGKSRGFITLATGDKRYYQLAANLLASYRLQAHSQIPFAIIAEEKNEYTDLFDETVLIDNPSRSFMDKIKMVEYVPYDENIFIDADCLIYKDIQYLWNLFDDSIGVFSAIGEMLSLDSDQGWFKKADIGEYGDKISYVAHLHGGIYFIRKEQDALRTFLQTCNHIIANYSQYHFRMFDKPADEPVLALAMAAHNLKMVQYEPTIMCFYPSTTIFKADIRKNFDEFVVPWHHGKLQGRIVHWGNFNTKRATYIREVERLKQVECEKKNDLFIDSKYFIHKFFESAKDRLITFKNALNSKKQN